MCNKENPGEINGVGLSFNVTDFRVWFLESLFNSELSVSVIFRMDSPSGPS